MRVASTVVKCSRVAKRGSVEVSAVYVGPVPCPSNLRGMRGCGSVVGSRVEAEAAERISMEMGLSSATTNMLIARVHLTAVVSELGSVVEGGKDVLSGHGNANVTSSWEAIRGGDRGHVP